MAHLIYTRLKKQKLQWFGSYYYPDIELNEVVRQDLEDQVGKLIKYWGTGDGRLYQNMQFRKLGRMDKIRLK